MKCAWFEPLVRGLNRRPRAVAVGCLLCLLLSGIGVFFIPFAGRLEVMLPKGSEAGRTLRFLRDANFADKVAVSLTLEQPGLGTQDLTAAMAGLGARLKSCPLITKVVRFPDSRSMLNDLLFFLDHCGELLSAQDLAGLKQRLTPQAVDRAIRSCQMRLLQPEGAMLQPIIRRDPLNISSVILGRIHRLTQSLGYRATIQDGYLIHPDGRHGLLLLETGVPVTDTVGSKKLLAALTAAVKHLPRGISADIICGHWHSVSNEKLLRRDVRLTVSIASVGFILLFLGIFRDFRAVIIFLIPAGMVLVALDVSALFFHPLSYFVIGFGAVMAGIAVDYGIHVYVAIRHCEDRYEAVRRILRPLLVGALTTVSVFAAFFVSAIPGYRQLAVFAVTAISLSILGAIFILPPFLKTGVAPLPSVASSRRLSNRVAVLGALFFLASLAVSAVLARGLKLDTGLRHLDGTPARILNEEKNFEKLWSNRETDQGIAVVSAKTYDRAAEANERLYHAMHQGSGAGSFSSLAAFWPSPRTRAGNLRRWNAFWTPERVRDVRKSILAAGAKYGFRADAFAPFLRLLSDERTVGPLPDKNVIFSQLLQRFHFVKDGRDWFMSFFPDTSKETAAVQAALNGIPGGFIASRRALGKTLSRSVAREVFRISGVALVLILGVTFLLMRDVRMSLIAVLPAACGVLWLFAIMAVSGQSLNIANMIAGIVVVGLCIDYGIFMVHGWARSAAVLTSTRNAVTLSAVTTLIGAGVLIFAKHPALFSIGLTLVVGISAGFLASLFGVPGLCVMFRIGDNRQPTEP